MVVLTAVFGRAEADGPGRRLEVGLEAEQRSSGQPLVLGDLPGHPPAVDRLDLDLWMVQARRVRAVSVARERPRGGHEMRTSLV